MGKNGGVKEASKTSYEINFTYRGVHCRERIKLKPTTANRQRVENFLGAIKDAIDRDVFNYAVTFPKSKNRLNFLETRGEALLVSEYLDRWLDGKEKTLKASTFLSYSKACTLITKEFLGLTMKEVTRPRIKQWMSKQTSSNKNLTNLQSVFRTALQDAVYDEIIEQNPLFGWKYKNNEAPKDSDEIDPFNKEEQSAILSELKGQAKNMIQFFFWTGLRPSELVALNWDDIDFRRGEVNIKKSLTQAAKKIETTKTSSSKRSVKLLPPALQALQAQKQHTYLKNEEIFQDERTGERLNGDRTIRNTIWRPALRRAKVRYRRPYQMRHTYASMMLTADESIAWLSRQLGHSSVITTMNIYAKFIKDSIPEAGNKAVDMFGDNIKNVVKML